MIRATGIKMNQPAGGLNPDQTGTGGSTQARASGLIGQAARMESGRAAANDQIESSNKAGNAAAGAAIGGIAGSIIPGVGTMIGATIGGLIGGAF